MRISFAFVWDILPLRQFCSLTTKFKGRAIETNSCGIFLDLSKAFDTVDHTILLAKLQHYGLRGIAYDWFDEYLTNRQELICLYE